MKVSLLIGTLVFLLAGCIPEVEVPKQSVTFADTQAARGEYVAARLGDSGLEPSAEVTVSVDGVPARVVSFNARVVVFEVPPSARETAEPVPVVVAEGRTVAEGQLQILGEVVPGQVTALVVPEVDLGGRLEQALQNFFERESGLFSNLQTVRGEPVGVQPQERRTLLQPLGNTGFEASIEANSNLLKQTTSPCLGDLVTLNLNGVPLEELLQELANVDLPGDGDAYGRGGQSGEEALVSIGIDPANRFFTGRGVTIAVLDSGLDRGLFGKPWLDTLDYNFVIDSTTNLDDPALHGTAAALAAAGDGVGVAPAADLLPLKVCGDDLRCRGDWVALGICHALLHAPRGPQNLVLNLSFGSPLKLTVHELLLNHAVTKLGVGVAASAGNEAEFGSPAHYPAAYEFVTENPREVGDGLIAVAALDAQLQPWADGTRGDYIDVTAPGVSLANASLGTSFSAPYAAGTVALFKEAAAGGLAPGEVEVCLEQGADASASFAANEVGSGVLNVAAALKICGLLP